jgi:competence protein ComEC
VAWAGGLRGSIGRGRAIGLERVASVPGPGGALLASTLLGDKRRLTGTVTEADLRTAGLAHFATTSGYHVVLVVALAGALLLACGTGRRTRTVLVIAMAAAFVLLSGGRIAAVRAGAVAAIAAIGWITGRRADALSALAITGLVFVVASPPVVFDLGFQLSFSAVAGIMLFGRLCDGWVRAALPRRAAGLSGPLALSLCAIGITLPLSASAFGQVSLAGPIANLLAAPLVSASLVLGLFGLGTAPLNTGLGSAVLKAAAVPAAACAELAAWIARVPRASIPVGAASAALALAWIGALAAIWTVWPQPSRARARIAGWVLCALVAAAALGVSSPVAPRVVVMDVGQGDAILVADGQREVLIDTGPDAGSLRAALGRQGVRSLDAVVLTHLHSDHVGGLSALRGLVSVGQLCVPEGARDKPSETLSEAERLVGTDGIAELNAGSALNVGSIALEVVSPEDGSVDAGTNEASVIVVARRGERSALLTGDAESAVLDRLVARGSIGHVEVLKVGHHGSAISLDPKVLGVLQPDAAVISVGAGNRFRHPRPEPLRLLSASGVPVWRTDQDGDVTIALDGQATTLAGSRPRLRGGLGARLWRPSRLATRAVAYERLTSIHPTRPTLLLESNDRLARRSQARLPHLRDRGPPARAGARPAHWTRVRCRRSRFQLREL